MITDAQMTFGEAFAYTSSTQVLTNVIDTGAVGPNINENSMLELVIYNVAAAAGGTSITINLLESAAENLGTPTTLWTSGAILDAALTVNTRLARIVLPRNQLRYLGIQVVNSGTHSAGTLTAYIVETSDSGRIYEHETGL